jgi:hypothetical protein
MPREAFRGPSRPKAVRGLSSGVGSRQARKGGAGLDRVDFPDGTPVSALMIGKVRLHVLDRN